MRLHLRTANSGSQILTNGSLTHVEVNNQELGFYRFTGAANSSYTVILSNLVFTPSSGGPGVTLYLYSAIDGLYAEVSCSLWVGNQSCNLPASAFTANGDYGLVFVPKFNFSAKFDAAITSP